MTSAPAVFANDEFRIELTPDADGFRVAASGVARALGFHEARDLVRSIPDAEKGSELAPTPGGDQRVWFLTEPGFYRALGQRQTARIKDAGTRAQVERFQSWVFGEVLPAIRKTGRYEVAQREPSRRELALLVIEAEDARELAEAQRDEARAELEVATPKAEAFDDLMDADGAYSMEAAAKALAPVTGGIGRNLLFRWLRQQGVLQANNVPYQRTAHWFRVVLSTYTNRAGELVPTTTTRVLPAGVDGIRRLWLRTQALALTAEPVTTGSERR